MSLARWLAVLMVCTMGVSAVADVPQLLNYQGKLTRPAGLPIEGNVAVGFGFYDAETVGNLLYSEEQTVTAAKGIFHVLIGNGSNPQGNFAAICAGANVWLELTVAGQAMAPRQRIGSVVFALKAGTADGLDAMLARLAEVERKLQYVDVQGTTMLVAGANLQVVNGLGNTETTNGLGNLIVGYNEPRDNGTDDRTGSHNIVVGKQHNFSSFGGLVAGMYNTISGSYATVSGGYGNAADGYGASVSGGYGNTADGYGASVSGGYGNAAGGDYASVSGGFVNMAIGNCASVSGGAYNTANGAAASISGGGWRVAGGTYDWSAGALWQDQ